MGLVVALLLAGCFAKADTPVYTIAQRGTDGDKKAFCSDFDMTEAQVEDFFRRSTVISFKTLHDQYDYLPCYVSGSAIINDKTCDWEVRAGGIGIKSCDNIIEYHVCEDCLPQ